MAALRVEQMEPFGRQADRDRIIAAFQEASMSQQNIELAKAGYAAFGRGDIPGLLSLLDAGIEWKTPGAT
ncbi:MAG: hypothetical protein HC869_25215, partial [Rhodospirillales bacterium]|nr:hypothetical protein [Rhodospirillales bacterium]